MHPDTWGGGLCQGLMEAVRFADSTTEVLNDLIRQHFSAVADAYICTQSIYAQGNTAAGIAVCDLMLTANVPFDRTTFQMLVEASS